MLDTAQLLRTTLLSGTGEGSTSDSFQRQSIEPTPSALEQNLQWASHRKFRVPTAGADTVIEAIWGSITCSAVAVAALSALSSSTFFKSRAVDLILIAPHHGWGSAESWSRGTQPRNEIPQIYLDCVSDILSISADHPHFRTCDLSIGLDLSIGNATNKFRATNLMLASQLIPTQAEETELASSYFVYRDNDAVDDRLKEIFTNLARKWRAERSQTDPGLSMFLRPGYQEIIGLGIQAVPLILRELEREVDHWFWALAAITRENPVPQQFRGDLRKMRDYWLSWGRSYGFRW